MAIRIYPNPTGHTAKYPIDITYRRTVCSIILIIKRL